MSLLFKRKRAIPLFCTSTHEILTVYIPLRLKKVPLPGTELGEIIAACRLFPHDKLLNRYKA